jgi:hypothetical protein
MRGLKIAAIVVGALIILIGLGLIVPGSFLLWAYSTQRDASGYFQSSERSVHTSGYALTTGDLNVDLGAAVDWLPKVSSGKVRVRAASTEGRALFIGIGPTDRVSQYLSAVARDEVTNFGWSSKAIKYQHFDGGAPSAPPSSQDFWIAEQEGLGEQTLDWQVQDGNWTTVVMNNDSSAPVRADLSLGLRLQVLLPVAIGLLAVGIVLLAIAALLIYLGARRPRSQLSNYPPGVYGPGAYPQGNYPPGGYPSGIYPPGGSSAGSFPPSSPPSAGSPPPGSPSLGSSSPGNPPPGERPPE